MTQIMEGLSVPILPSTRDEPFRRVVQGLKEPVTRRRRLDIEGTEERYDS